MVKLGLSLFFPYLCVVTVVGDPINAKFKGRPGRVAKLDPVFY